MKKISFLILLTLIGCTDKTKIIHQKSAELQKQQDEAAAIDPRSFLPINELNNQEFAIETLDPVLEDENSIATETANDTSGNGSAFQIVDYKSKAPYLDLFNNRKWPLLARPNTTGKYSFLFEFKNQELVISKLANLVDLSESEKTYSTAFGNRYKVAQFVIPVNYYSQKLNNGRKNQFIPTDHVESASHFIPNFRGATHLERSSREYVFPRSYFEDSDWFFSQTVIDTGRESQLSKGFDLSFDFKFESASRVRFQIDRTRMAVKNLNLDPSYMSDKKNKDQFVLNAQDVINFPAELIDFRLKPVRSGETQLVEEEMGDSHPNRRTWDKRKYIRVDINKMTSALKNYGSEPSLLSMSVEPDYFSFTVFDQGLKIKVKYSFKKSSTKAQPLTAFENDVSQKFGYFVTHTDYIAGQEYVRRSDQQNFVFINKFYPTTDEKGNKQIVFHFSNTSPGKESPFRISARKAIAEWNSAFHRANTGISVLLDETFDVELGDIRYNIINLIEEKGASGGLLGFGPTIADTHSGQIISASTNIYVTTFLNQYISMLRHYTYYQLGLITDRQVYNPIPMITNIQNQVSQWGYQLPKFPFLNEIPDSNLSLADQPKEFSGHSSGCGYYGLAQKNMIEEVNLKCKTSLLPYIEKLKKLNQGKSEIQTHIKGEELAALTECANSISQDELTHTILHELGHNFGLRHNFLASTDLANFTEKGLDLDSKEADETRQFISSSSVMDYIGRNSTPITKVGPYDIAAIRYAYANEVEILDKNGKPSGKFVRVNTQQSLKDQFKSSETKIRQFRYCTDEDVVTMAEGNVTKTSLCQRHDNGTTATEIARNIINSFNSVWEVYRKKYDYDEFLIGSQRGASPEMLLAAIIESNHLYPLMAIYGEWRTLLARYMDDKRKIELFSYNPQEMNQLVRAITQKLSNEKRREFLDFYTAGQLVADFMSTMALTPDRLCVAKMKDGSYTSRAFEFFKDSNSVDEPLFKDCYDARVQQFFSKQGDVSKVFEIGEKYTNHRFSEETRENAVAWAVDELGFYEVGGKFINQLSLPYRLFEEQETLAFSPVLIHEPLVKDRMIRIILDRLKNGVQLKAEDNQIVYLKHFATLSDVLIKTWTSLLHSISSSTKETINPYFTNRYFNTILVSNLSELNSNEFNSGFVARRGIEEPGYWAAPSSAPKVMELISTYFILSNRNNFLDASAEKESDNQIRNTLNSIFEKVEAFKLPLSGLRMSEYLALSDRLINEANQRGEKWGFLVRNILSDTQLPILLAKDSGQKEKKVNDLPGQMVVEQMQTQFGLELKTFQERIENEIKGIQDFELNKEEYVGQISQIKMHLDTK